MLLETFIDNQVRAREREGVTVLLLHSNCSLFTDMLELFHLAKIDPTKKIFPEDFIVFLSYRNYKYFVIPNTL